MSSIVDILEKPRLKNPVLIEGLPGTGFVANIAALHLITEFKAKKFVEIRSPTFQDLVISAEGGLTRSPVNELYYHHSSAENDVIILYGNTQALTAFGQYELCGRILDVAQEFECQLVASMGGLRRDRVASPRRVYCTATDHDTLNHVLKNGAEILHGNVTGVAGLLIGLAKLRKMRGFCLLAETAGVYPDVAAAKSILDVLCKVLGVKVNLERLSIAVEETEKILRSFNFMGALQSSGFSVSV